MKKILIAALMLPLTALAQTYPSPTFSSLTLQNPLTAANGGTGSTSATGTGSAVLSNSPTLVSPALGTPSSATLTNATGLPASTGISGLGTGVATALGNAVTGSGGAVLATSPTIAAPTITGSLTANGLVTISDLAKQTANTILGNGSASTASPTALAVPSCSVVGSALTWTSGTGFSCSAIMTQTATGQFFASNGARIDRLNDRIFLGTATQYDGNQTPSTGDWSKTTFPVTGGQGAYEYLVSGAMIPIGAIGGTLGLTAYGRTSDGTGGGTQATIGVSSFVVNDNTTGAGAASWNYYGTTVRTATATGSNTNNMELDVANLGATVKQYPNAMYPNGFTDGIGINAGGELQNDSSVTMGTNTAALTISQNDVTGHANWDKGIIFQSTAIAGCNGTGGSNTCPAIAMSPGHEIQYYNNSNAVTGGFFSSATTVGGTNYEEQYVQLSNFGTIFTDGNDFPQFRVNNATTSAADYVQVDAANTGGSPMLSAVGTDTNVNLTLQGKGIGTVVLPQDDVLTYFNTSGQSIPNSTSTVVTGWTSNFDRLGTNFNATTGTFTAPVAGYYHVDAGINYAASAPSAVGDFYQATIVVGGVTKCIGQQSAQSTGSTVHATTVGCDISISAGQTLTINTSHNFGSSTALATAAGVNYISIHRIP
jgi:hypothetical protein